MDESGKDVDVSIVERTLTDQEKVEVDGAMQEGLKNVRPGLKEKLNRWANESVATMLSTREVHNSNRAIEGVARSTDMIGPWIEIISTAVAEATGGLSEENKRGQGRR